MDWCLHPGGYMGTQIRELDLNIQKIHASMNTCTALTMELELEWCEDAAGCVWLYDVCDGMV